MRYRASGRTSRCARIASKVWVLANLRTAKAPIRPALGPALSWSALGAFFCMFLTSLAFGHVSMLQGRRRNVRLELSCPCFGGRVTFVTFWGPSRHPMLVAFWGNQAPLYSLRGVSGPVQPPLDLAWAPLLEPGPLRAPFGTRYGASGRTSSCARVASKVWVLAHLAQPVRHYTPLGGPLETH